MNLERYQEANGKTGWSSNERALSPERYTVVKIRGIKETSDPTINSDYGRIARWMSDEDTRRHLRAPIGRIEDFSNRSAVEAALIELGRYYHNQNRRDEAGNIIEDDPRKITPFAAVNESDEIIGVTTVRWRGNPFIEEDQSGRTASVENVIVDPMFQHKHLDVGVQMMGGVLETIFNGGYAPYDGKPADAVRLWIFTDVKDWEKVEKFYERLGFLNVGGEEGSWKEYCEKRAIPYDGRKGKWFELKRDRWEKMKMSDSESGDPKFKLNIVDKTSLRSPIPVRGQKRAGRGIPTVN